MKPPTTFKLQLVDAKDYQTLPVPIRILLTSVQPFLVKTIHSIRDLANAGGVSLNFIATLIGEREN